MTCIIAHVKNGVGYMAGDYLASNSHMKVDRKDDKVFEKHDMLFGFTSSYRMGQILKYCFEPPKNEPKLTDHGYMVKLFIPELIKVYNDNSYGMKTTKGDAVGGTFLVIRNGKIFCIEGDFQVGEYKDNIWTCGSGYEVAYGAMKAFEYSDFSPEEKLRKSITITSEIIGSVGKRCKIIKKDFQK